MYSVECTARVLFNDTFLIHGILDRIIPVTEQFYTLVTIRIFAFNDFLDNNVNVPDVMSLRIQYRFISLRCLFRGFLLSFFQCFLLIICAH